jgi:hypothetical protein
MRRLLYLGLLLLLVVRADFWQWDDGRLWWGLPVGLTYHVLFCLAVSCWMALLVRFVGPGSSGPGEGSEPR